MKKDFCATHDSVIGSKGLYDSVIGSKELYDSVRGAVSYSEPSMSVQMRAMIYYKYVTAKAALSYLCQFESSELLMYI